VFEKRCINTMAVRSSNPSAESRLRIFYADTGALARGCGLVHRAPVPSSAVELSCLFCGDQEPKFSLIFLIFIVRRGSSSKGYASEINKKHMEVK